MPQVFGPRIFNIYVIDIFHFVEYTDVLKFEDDRNPHSSGYNVNELVVDINYDSYNFL